MVNIETNLQTCKVLIRKFAQIFFRSFKMYNVSAYTRKSFTNILTPFKKLHVSLKHDIYKIYNPLHTKIKLKLKGVGFIKPCHYLRQQFAIPPLSYAKGLAKDNSLRCRQSEKEARRSWQSEKEGRKWRVDWLFFLYFCKKNLKINSIKITHQISLPFYNLDAIIYFSLYDIKKNLCGFKNILYGTMLRMLLFSSV